MTHLSLTRIARAVAILWLFSALCLPSLPAAETSLFHSDFETSDSSGTWPEGWPRHDQASWESENGNRFLRLKSPEPGKMILLYRELSVPENAEALELSWRQRITDLERGEKPWFDARIMMEFMNVDRNKATPGPPSPHTGRDTDGWVEKRVSFLVADGATLLKFMPCLFNVNSGTFDLDDIHLRVISPNALRDAKEETQQRKAEQQAARTHSSQDKATRRLETTGNLIPDGGFESTGGKSSIVEENGNHFLRLTAVEPGELVMEYREVDLPADVPALKLEWRQRVTGLKKGKMPWFDARLMLDFKDADGKSVKGKPSPPYTQKDTDGWEERSKAFLVPKDAVRLVVMSTLFRVEAGTYDLDDFVLRPTAPGPLHARKQDRARQAAARHVPDEKPDRSKWPPMLHVEGNNVLDAEGNEVWLQGVNAGGLETLPHDTQCIKSLVVAIEDWNANCVRVPIKEEFWWGESPYQKDGGEGYRGTIDKMVTLAANRGAYIVIDLHRYRAPKPEHAKFWKEFAALYKDHPAVLFDLFNEPHGISWEVWRNGGFVGTKKGRDESAFLTDQEKRANQGFESVGMQGLVDAVRSTGAKNLLIAGGIFWCNDLTGIVNGYALNDRNGNGIMYSWHTYNWHPGWARILPVLEKHPVFLGETGADPKKMGFIDAELQEDPYTWVPDMLGFIQKHNIHWTAWCFHPRATPRLLVDWDYTPTPFWGVFAKQALSGKQFEMTRMR